MECRPAPDLSQTRTSILAGLDIARPEPDQTIDCHEIFPHGDFHTFKRKILIIGMVLTFIETKSFSVYEFVLNIDSIENVS